MALFHMQRFVDGEKSHMDESRSSESILKRLHEKARARERQSADSSYQSGNKEQQGRRPDENSDAKQKRFSESQRTREKFKKRVRKKSLPPEVILKRLHAKAKRRERTAPQVSADLSGGIAVPSGSALKKSSERGKELPLGVSDNDKNGDLSPSISKKRKSGSAAVSTAGKKKIKKMPRKAAKETERDSGESSEEKLKTSSQTSFSIAESTQKDPNRTEEHKTHKVKDCEAQAAAMDSAVSRVLNKLATAKNSQKMSAKRSKQKRKLSGSSGSDVKDKKHSNLSSKKVQTGAKKGPNSSFWSSSGDNESADEEHEDMIPEPDRGSPDQEPHPVKEDSIGEERSSENKIPEEVEYEDNRSQDSIAEDETEESLMLPADDVSADVDGEDGSTGQNNDDDGKDSEKGFTVLGGERKKKKQKVARVLPDWLAHPTVIEHDLRKHSVTVEEMEQMDSRLVRSLLDEGIKSLFPVQRHVIPVILDSARLGIHAGDAGYRPRDLCVSAPTGSGKTLAFALPIIQALLDRVVPRIRALVVLPTRDLAQQVSKVFSSLCKATDLRPALIGGLKKFAQEQRMLVQTSTGETQCDIVVATPGRLVDHINKTQGFTLQYLRFLVIDEADRMMEQISQDWISQVEKCAFTGSRPAPGPITVESCRKISLPLQKLLFSATLSQNPEKLIQLNLFRPRLITSVVTSKSRRRDTQLGEGKMEERGEFVGKYTTPVGLKEYYIQCTPGQKPLLVLHLVQTLNLRQILCFANTVEATRRLYHLIKLVGGMAVAEFSSNQTAGQRRQILKKFKAGKIQLLICSDAMARGMDVENAEYVISYDMPPYIKTYIHRVGRTARAGKTGVAFTLLQPHEVPKLLKMLKHAGKTNIQKHGTDLRDLDHLVPAYKKALQQLPGVLKMEKFHSV